MNGRARPARPGARPGPEPALAMPLGAKPSSGVSNGSRGLGQAIKTCAQTIASPPKRPCLNGWWVFCGPSRRKDKTVNYAAIWAMFIDTTSIASCDVSKFYSNLLVVKVLEYCHDEKSQFVNSLAPTVTDPVRSPEHHGALPGGRAMAWSHLTVPQL